MSFKIAVVVAVCALAGTAVAEKRLKAVRMIAFDRPMLEYYDGPVLCEIGADCAAVKKANNEQNLKRYIEAVDEWEKKNPNDASEFTRLDPELVRKEQEQRLRLFKKVNKYILPTERPQPVLTYYCTEGDAECAAMKKAQDKDVWEYLKAVDKWEFDWPITAQQYAKEHPEQIAADDAEWERLEASMALVDSSEGDASSEEF